MMNIVDSFQLVAWRERCIYREEVTKLTKGGKQTNNMKTRVKKQQSTVWKSLYRRVLKKPEKEVKE